MNSTLFKDKKLIRLILWGIVASAFFSSTFILNRAISLGGGHWVWTASLRYFYMIIMLFLWLIITKGITSVKEVFLVLKNHWKFWILAGTIGFGFFYAPLVFASQYAPGWIVASTWQFTILATALILILFGKKLPLKALSFSLLIFIGIILVNFEQAAQVDFTTILLGVIPIIIAAFSYPFGNQLVGEAKQGTHRFIPHITDKIMDSAPARVLLMTLGSIPFWIILILITKPYAPSANQLLSTAIVALSSGVIATSLFLYSRHQATKAYEVAAVDATQAGETVFTLIGEVLFLGIALPGLFGWMGLFLIIMGLVIYSLKQAK